MKIPITMCHGINENHDPPFDAAHMTEYFRMASELGFESISYDALDAWRNGAANLPEHPIMFDFDHPTRSIHDQIHPVMTEYGFKANLFINTGPMEELYSGDGINAEDRSWMLWEEIGVLIEGGWHIGAHTHTHPNLSKLFLEDPSGDKLRQELTTNDAILKKELGVETKDFAFTGTSWSSAAEKEVMHRYRFGRLWIVGAEYQADGEPVRYADLVGVSGEDESDGGPPAAARYITEAMNPYRLPSMELERLIFEHDAYRRYLEGALEA